MVKALTGHKFETHPVLLERDFVLRVPLRIGHWVASCLSLSPRGKICNQKKCRFVCPNFFPFLFASSEHQQLPSSTSTSVCSLTSSTEENTSATEVQS